MRITRITVSMTILIFGVWLAIVACGPVSAAVEPTLTYAQIPTPVQSPKSASFKTRDLTIAPDTAELGQIVTVNVIVENGGEQAGTYTAELKVDGYLVKTQDVVMAAGSNQKMTFNFPVHLAGTFEVRVGQASAKLVVQAAEPEMSGMPDMPWGLDCDSM